jgi:hypothetical protein
VKKDSEDDCAELVRKFGEYALEAEREPLPLDENATDEVSNDVLLPVGAPELIVGAELVVWRIVIVGEVDEVAVPALCEGSGVKLEWATSITL